LIDNVDWTPYATAGQWLEQRNKTLVMFWDQVQAWWTMALAKYKTWPLLVGDNLAYDYGKIHSELAALPESYYIKRSVRYMKNVDGTPTYTSQHTVARWKVLLDAGAIEKQEPLVECEHTHLASDDALSIAAQYAAYSTKYPQYA
jgi:hypothetical protein